MPSCVVSSLWHAPRAPFLARAQALLTRYEDELLDMLPANAEIFEDGDGIVGDRPRIVTGEEPAIASS